MKKIRMVSAGFFLLFLVACSNYQDQANNFLADETIRVDTETETEAAEVFTELDLNQLIDNFEIPKQKTEHLDLSEDVEGFPRPLINQIKMAMVNDSLEALFDELNEDELIVSFADIEPMLQLRSDTDTYEQRVYNLYYSEYPIRYNVKGTFYQFDIDKDGTEELFCLEQNVDSYNYGGEMLHVFTMEDGMYRYHTSYDFNYHRYCGIVAYDGIYYLIANKDDYDFKTTEAVELYCLDSGILKVIENGYLGSVEKYMTINRTIDDFQFDVLYKNQAHPETENILSYVDTIAVDLMHTDRIHKYFYGNEMDDSDVLFRQYKEHENYKYYKPLHSADVNNDGEKELFIRYSTFEHYTAYPETTLVWCRTDTLTEYELNIPFWSNADFKVTQRWFKQIGNKTVSFSLHCQTGDDVYILDARLHENDRTVILAEYIIYPEYNAACMESTEVVTNNIKEKKFETEPVAELVPDFESKLSNFSIDSKGPFIPAQTENDTISKDLLLFLEEALYNGEFGELEKQSALHMVDKDSFYQQFSKRDDIVYGTKELYESRVEKVYEYQMNGIHYYVVIKNEKSGYDNNFIYIEDNGQLKLDKCWMTENLDRWVMSFEEHYYLIEVFDIPYWRTEEAFSDRFFVIRLDSVLPEAYTVISYRPFEFDWMQVYHSEEHNAARLDEYIRSIRDELTEDIYVDRETRFYYQELSTFAGDETDITDIDKLLRVQSVSVFNMRNRRYFSYCEMDYDNDGIPNYLNRIHVGYRLSCDFYEITEDRTMEVLTNLIDSEPTGTPVQLWFKEFDGTVYTFKLYWHDNYNFYMKVSLLEGEKEQTCRIYLISPRNEYDIYNVSLDDW